MVLINLDRRTVFIGYYSKDRLDIAKVESWGKYAKTVSLGSGETSTALTIACSQDAAALKRETCINSLGHTLRCQLLLVVIRVVRVKQQRQE